MGIRTDMSNEKIVCGNVIHTHVIGDHVITEYEVGPEYHDAGQIEFLCNATDSSSLSLEDALIDSICHKLSPDDYHLSSYVLKLIYASKHESEQT